jgi:glycosyltransferase involved in cell wall biosynthesis
VADSVNPLKVYEYLAMGRPVVSAPMEALRLEDAGDAVAFAADAASFCEEIDRALQADVQAEADDRRRAVAPYTWDNLFTRLDSVCGTALAA